MAIDNSKQYAFIIGAAKTGTTSISDILAQHPDICLSFPKESDYFARHYHKGEDWYDSLFQGKVHKLRLDASTSYSAGFEGSSEAIAKRIKAACPNAKMVYVVRDPLERTWSSYWHAKRAGFESDSFMNAINRADNSHIAGSLYHQRMQEYLAHFPKENLLVVAFSDFKRNPKQVIDSIINHLNMSPYSFSEEAYAQKSNASFKWKGPFSVVNLLPAKTLKSMTLQIKKILPTSVVNKMKGAVSEPIPKMTENEANATKTKLAADVELFYQSFNVDVRTSQWWHSPDNDL
ncbi:sulfotransferase family protein [Flocculibacter collagenilyticus]|uniref:sulfotransferase family protein n=1 Tax=Flocculibacter collagenilyticus TaxID=2744479 RepID=UPI0018F61217|nr:sulfotransferase [Flocculibacter collagenilyticus]